MNERTIHFLCGCGRTLRADTSSGESLKCDGCGRTVGVPVARNRATGEVKRPADGKAARKSGHFDFDAEIVNAARTAPRRALKTPSGVTRTPSEEIAARAEAPPRSRLEKAARRVGILALAVLLVVGGAAVPAFFLPLPLWQRGVLALVLLVAGVGLSAALATLRLLCLGLNDRR